MAIGLSSLFLIIFAGFQEVPIDNNNELVRTRVMSLNNMIDRSFYYSENALSVAGFSAFDSLYGVVNQTSPPSYLNNFAHNFTTCTHNATNCYNQNNFTSLMRAYQNIINSTTPASINIRINNVTFVMEHHWTIELRSSITVELNDTYASWIVTRDIDAEVPILGAKDPAYLAISAKTGLPEERFIVTNSDEYGRWGLSRFRDFFFEREYIEWQQAPCLSHRFEGDFNASSRDCGITSVVDANYHQNLKDNVANRNITHLDYQVLRPERYPCNVNFPGAIPRISIRAVSYNLTLNQEDATHFGLNNNSIWFYEPSISHTTAWGCNGFPFAR